MPDRPSSPSFWITCPPTSFRSASSAIVRCTSSGLLLPRPVFGHGFCAVDLPRESSRHRSLPGRYARQAVPHGLPRAHNALHAGRRQRGARLAHLCDFALVLIAIARPLYASDPLGVDLVQVLYALDSTTIDLCLSVFPWARFRKHKGAVKMHTLLDLRGNIPTFIRITDGKVHDVNILDELLIEAGAFYVMDRGYIDFERLYSFTLSLRPSSWCAPKRMFCFSDAIRIR
jgi:hypothetical protein